MPRQHGVQADGHLLGCRAPPDLAGVGQLHFLPSTVRREPDQVVLAADVPVDGGCGGVQAIAEGSHVESFESFVVQQSDRGRDDLLEGEGVAWHASTIRPAALT